MDTEWWKPTTRRETASRRLAYTVAPVDYLKPPGEFPLIV